VHRKLLEPLGKYSFPQCSENIAKEAWELEAHSEQRHYHEAVKKLGSHPVGKPTILISENKPTGCLSRGCLSQHVFLWVSLLSEKSGAGLAT
jgi:hypothetical protein